MSTLDAFPALRETVISLACCNGGINRGRTVEDYLMAVEPFVSEPPVADYLGDMDRWLGTLSFAEQITLVDGGDEGEVDELLQRCPLEFVRGVLDGLLTDLFEGAV